MMPTNGPSLGDTGASLRWYPGGTECLSIFDTVALLIPNRFAAVRSLMPSTSTARLTLA